MAQNLNYEYTNYFGDVYDNFCLANNPSYCEQFGRLYRWNAAMAAAGQGESLLPNGCRNDVVCKPIPPVQGVCPEGWHLPSWSEYQTLIRFAGGTTVAARKLKSTSGWDVFIDKDDNEENGNGTDDYSFTVLPAGSMDKDGWSYGVGKYSFFWTSTEDDETWSYALQVDYASQAVLSATNKATAFSVRCIKDN